MLFQLNSYLWFSKKKILDDFINNIGNNHESCKQNLLFQRKLIVFQIIHNHINNICLIKSEWLCLNKFLEIINKNNQLNHNANRYNKSDTNVIYIIRRLIHPFELSDINIQLYQQNVNYILI